MLELKDIRISLLSDGRKIVDGFDFTLAKGDRAVIIGEEGNGKSTLLKFIYDRASIADYCDASGVVKCYGKLAYLPQSVEDADNNITLRKYFEDFSYSPSAILLLDKLFPVELMTAERTLGSLSGGERVRARLLKLLSDEPDILLLDEPTNDLDIHTLDWLSDFLLAVKQPVIFISHDETLIERTANVILHMEQLERKTECRITVARMSYSEYMENRQTCFDKQRRVAQKQRDDYDRQHEKWRQIYDRVEYEQRTITRGDPSTGRLLKKKMHAVISMGKRFEREKENFTEFPKEEDAIITRFDEIRIPSGKIVLDYFTEKLCAGERTLAENVKLVVRGGEKIGIVGDNGAGKSTLLDAIYDELKCRRDVTVGFMPQDYSRVLDPELSPVEYLMGEYDKAVATIARTRLSSMRFTRAEVNGKISALSGGQRAKLLFLDMVLKRCDVLLLDEPTRNFSPLSAPVVRAALREFGGTVISVSHDRKFLKENCDSVYELTPTGLRLCSIT